MALDDILQRISADATIEADALTSAADAEAQATLASARSAAEAKRARDLARSRADAEREAATLLAGARLRARDAAVAARRELAESAIAKAVELVERRPDAEYAGLLARWAAQVAGGGETVLVGEADAARTKVLEAALAAAGVALKVVGTTPDPARGIVIVGDRVRAEVSVAATASSRHEELLAKADAALFDEGKE